MSRVSPRDGLVVHLPPRLGAIAIVIHGSQNGLVMALASLLGQGDGKGRMIDHGWGRGFAFPLHSGDLAPAGIGRARSKLQSFETVTRDVA